MLPAKVRIFVHHRRIIALKRILLVPLKLSALLGELPLHVLLALRVHLAGEVVRVHRGLLGCLILVVGCVLPEEGVCVCGLLEIVAV